MHVCAQRVPREVKKHLEIPWNWSYDLGPLQEQPILFTTEPSLQPMAFYL